MSARLVEPFPQPTAEEEAWKAGLWGAALAYVAVAWRRAGRRRALT